MTVAAGLVSGLVTGGLVLGLIGDQDQPVQNEILLEDGTALLLEDGSSFLLESA